jgi:YesN/AraC family two-component response regulator
MDSEYFCYSNDTNTFAVSHRKAQSHIMPDNHFHNTFEAFYLVEGERNFFIKDGTFRIKEGDLVLIHPNVLHRTMNTMILGHENIIVNFHREELTAPKYSFPQILFTLFEKEYTIISLTLQHRIYVEELLNKILQEVQQQKTGFEMYSQALVLELMIYCCRFVEQNTAKELTYPSPRHERISAIVQFINKNYARELDLHYLAERFYISPYYLSRAFKEVTGFSFIEYLNSLRIKEAKKLLEESQQKVANIAKTVGYGSRTHFGRVFREITGHSPLYYRRTGRAVHDRRADCKHTESY